MVQAEPYFSRHPRLAATVIGLLLLLFGAQAWRAVRLESPTYDETTHFLGAYTAATLHDYRINTEHPLLWKWWAVLPDLFAGPYRVDTASPSWSHELVDRTQTRRFMQDTLFHTPGNDTEGFFARARFMMLLVGVGLGGLIAWWARRLAGWPAAVVAVAFYAFDPNFLGHAPLLTNDVAMSLMFCAVMSALWRVGQVASPARIVVLGTLFGLSVIVKYSALGMVPILVVLLGVRALLGGPWTIPGGELSTRATRLMRAVAIAATCGAMAYATIWASYGFRFGVSPDPSVHKDMKFNERTEALWTITSREHRSQFPSPQEIDAEPPSLFTRAFVALDEYRLLPEAFIDGVLYAHARGTTRRTFFFGNLSEEGSWSYFPAAVLVKTPLATLAALLIAFALLIAARPGRLFRDGLSERGWDLACLLLPPMFWFSVAMIARLNIGLRHVFPVYPFLFIGIGVAAARALQLEARQTKWMLAGLLTALVAESTLASPDYLAFFNSPAGGARGGLTLLSDSNLDWGQGLKEMARWQRAHPDEPLQLAYFGSVLPEYYGIHATTLSNGWSAGIQPPAPVGVVAISATLLQTLPPHGELHPFDVLGGSIYLFHASELIADMATVSHAQKSAAAPEGE